MILFIRVSFLVRFIFILRFLDPGDMGVVRIGKNSNVQDRVLIGSGNKNILNKTPSVTQIGEYVTIGMECFYRGYANIKYSICVIHPFAGHEAIIDRSQIGDFGKLCS